MARAIQMLLVMLLGLGAVDAAHARGDPRLEVEIAFGVSGSTELRTVVMTSPKFTLSAPIGAESGFVAKWGFTVASGEPTDPSFDPTWFAVGNPVLGWSVVLIEGLVLTPSITLPLASFPSRAGARPAADFAYRGSLGLRGAVESWLWRPDQFAVLFPFNYVTWLDPLLLEAHAKLAYLMPTTADDADADIVLEASLRVAAHMGGRFWLAGGVAAVYTPTDTGDNFNIALAPELRYVLDAGSHVELSLLMNLDTPYGPFTTPGRFWAVHIGGSASF